MKRTLENTVQFIDWKKIITYSLKKKRLRIYTKKIYIMGFIV